VIRLDFGLGPLATIDLLNADSCVFCLTFELSGGPKEAVR
jgi:hypothetical protein